MLLKYKQEWWKTLLKRKREWWNDGFWNGSGSDETILEMEAGLIKIMVLKWKRKWWEECCWNGSACDEKNVAEMETVFSIKFIF